MNGINDFADIAHPGATGRVHLHHIDMAAFGNGAAGFALATRLGRGTAGAIGADAVQPLGDDACGRRLAGATDAGHDEGMRDPVGGKGVFQCANHRLLADQIGKGFGAVFPRQNLIGLRRGGICGVCHHASRDSCGVKTRRLGG